MVPGLSLARKLTMAPGLPALNSVAFFPLISNRMLPSTAGWEFLLGATTVDEMISMRSWLSGGTSTTNLLGSRAAGMFTLMMLLVLPVPTEVTRHRL